MQTIGNGLLFVSSILWSVDFEVLCVCFLLFPLKVFLSRCHHDRIVRNIFSDRAIETTGALENSWSKSQSEKEQLLAIGVEKYIAVMRSFLVWQIGCGTNTISNILNSMVMVTLPIFHWKFPFADTLSKKSMLLSLMLISCFHWWSSLFLL